MIDHVEPRKYRKVLAAVRDSRVLSGVRSGIRNARDFVSPAPRIEGVDPRLQEQSLCRLIALKVRRARGETLSFADKKTLGLSNRSAFPKNSSRVEGGKLEIDREIVPLCQAINSKQYAFTHGSCSGHIENGFFKDTGFIGVTMDLSDTRAGLLKEALKKLCEDESRADQECAYFIEEFARGTKFAIYWKWNHPAYRKDRELIEAIQRTEDPAEIRRINEERHGEDLYREMLEASKLAIEQGIHERHMEFVKKAADLISGSP
ncbi:MAG: hypothetical protein WC285_04260 [Candidatus Gracilibacteria bacterium]|jgi:hypothetical protein